jgi:hypothetical protein
MNTKELYHGTKADNILSIMKEGLIRPNNGKIYCARSESEYPTLFQYGADTSRGAAFVIKVRAELLDNSRFKAVSRPGAPRDAWALETGLPLKVEVLKLYVRIRPGEPVRTLEAPQIAEYLRPKT